MPRQPKLRKKTVRGIDYWFTKAGGDTYFGTVDDVPFKDARRLFTDHVQSLLDGRNDSKKKRFTAGDLMDLFLEWVKKHRSDQKTASPTCPRIGSRVPTWRHFSTR